MKNADSACKYLVLISFTIYIGLCISYYLRTSQTPNLPDWIVSLFTMVFLYFFRKSPTEKPEDKDGDKSHDKDN